MYFLLKSNYLKLASDKGDLAEPIISLFKSSLQIHTDVYFPFSKDINQMELDVTWHTEHFNYIACDCAASETYSGSIFKLFL